MKKGAIFDQDGLMFDTEKIWQESWAATAAEFGRSVPEGFSKEICGGSGEGTVRTVKKYFPELDAGAFITRARERTYRKQQEYLPEKPGLRQLLQFFRENGVKMAVASSCRRGQLIYNLEHAGIKDYFADIVSSEDVINGKPAPDIFLKAAGKLGLAPGDCYVFEDSYNGIRAGHAAGCYTVMVPDLIQPDEEMAGIYDACIGSLLEVRDQIQAGEL